MINEQLKEEIELTKELLKLKEKLYQVEKAILELRPEGEVYQLGKLVAEPVVVFDEEQQKFVEERAN